MSNTIFSGVAQLPKRYDAWQGPRVELEDFETQLDEEIAERHGNEIYNLPCLGDNVGVHSFDLCLSDTNEYGIAIVLDKNPKDLTPDELKIFPETIGGLDVSLIGANSQREDWDLVTSALYTRTSRLIHHWEFDIDNNEPIVRMFTTDPHDQISKNVLEELRQPIGKFKVVLEYQDDQPTELSNS